jgi:hypothetical protein
VLCWATPCRVMWMSTFGKLGTSSIHTTCSKTQLISYETTAETTENTAAPQQDLRGACSTMQVCAAQDRELCYGVAAGCAAAHRLAVLKAEATNVLRSLVGVAPAAAFKGSQQPANL